MAMNDAITNSVWVTSPEYAGWLTKRGFAWRKLWRPRWVALHGAEIVYMEKEPTVFNHGLKMTKVQLTASTKVDTEDLDGNPLGFSLHFNDGKGSPVWYLRASSLREKKDWMTRLSHTMAIIYWLEDFEKVRVLGLGGTGIVYELLHKTNGQRYALKEIEIKNKAQMQVALQEAEMLKEIMENISHPNIMHIEKVFQVGSKFYLVFPLCTGGELYEHVIRRGKFTERDAAKLTRDLMSAIHALHSRDILHLDIKPENILFESLSDDSLIKLTDFGLSKFFGSLEKTETFLPSVAELDDRLKDFSENGVLNTVKLKGTVGYMAPELILTGHTSKATDIFAAGVVLYILLCGHPPFQSKSNRDVLEKTARGTFRLDGNSWRDVSDEAKDLVRLMLTRDPARRITVEDALAHPWLAHVDDEEDIADDKSKDAAAADTAAPVTADDPHAQAREASLSSSKQQQLQQQQQQSRNLSGLRLLSEHVAERRSEKFLSGLTNLVSFIQGGGNTSSKLIQFVRLADGQLLPMDDGQPPGKGQGQGQGASSGGAGNHHDSSSLEERFIFLSPYVRTAMQGAIRRGCAAEGGKMTVEQFLSVLKKLGIASGLPGMFLCRFVDRDGDGFISADDLFTTQALVMQRSDVFLRVVFRVYCESVWYPGRQLNLMHYYQQQSTPKKKPMSGGHRVLDEAVAADVIEPPKFITPRHVAEVFGKLGLDADDGKSVFGVLCESLERLYAKERSLSREESDCESDAGTGGSVKDGSGGGGRDNALPSPVHHRGSASGAEQDSARVSPPAPPSGSAATESADADADHPAPSSTPRPSRTGSAGAFATPRVGSISNQNISSAAQSQTPGGSAARAGAGSSAAKMDLADFMRCAELDDVLVQAILRRPRSGFVALVQRAKEQDRLKAEAAAAAGAAGAAEAEAGPSVLEEELVSALLAAKESNFGPSAAAAAFPIATAVARGTLSVLSGVQGVMSAAAAELGSSVRGMSGFAASEYFDSSDDDDDEDEVGVEGQGTGTEAGGRG